MPEGNDILYCGGSLFLILIKKRAFEDEIAAKQGLGLDVAEIALSYNSVR